METIIEAKEYLRANFDDGVSCPCCDQFVKLYKRKITSSMAWALILINRYNMVGQEFHLQDFMFNLNTQIDIPSSIYGDVPKLRFWGILEKVIGDREDGSSRNGYYKLTQKGLDFVNGTRVPKYISTFKDKVYNVSNEFTGIKECLADKFNYAELMSN